VLPVFYAAVTENASAKWSCSGTILVPVVSSQQHKALVKKTLKICGLFSVVAMSSSLTRGNFASYIWRQEGPSFAPAMLSPSVSAADREGVDATLGQKPTPGLPNGRVRASIARPSANWSGFTFHEKSKMASDLESRRRSGAAWRRGETATDEENEEDENGEPDAPASEPPKARATDDHSAAQL
jgi:hypothetical protein